LRVQASHLDGTPLGRFVAIKVNPDGTYKLSSQLNAAINPSQTDQGAETGKITDNKPGSIGTTHELTPHEKKQLQKATALRSNPVRPGESATDAIWRGVDRSSAVAGADAMRISPDPFDQTPASSLSGNNTFAQNHHKALSAAAKIQHSISEKGWPATVRAIATGRSYAELATIKTSLVAALQATATPAQRTAATHNLRTAQAVISAAEKVKQSPQPASSIPASYTAPERARSDDARRNDIAYARARLGGTHSALEIIDGLMRQPQGLSIAAGGFKPPLSRQQASSTLKAALKEERADLVLMGALMKKDTLNDEELNQLNSVFGRMPRIAHTGARMALRHFATHPQQAVRTVMLQYIRRSGYLADPVKGLAAKMDAAAAYDNKLSEIDRMHATQENYVYTSDDLSAAERAKSAALTRGIAPIRKTNPTETDRFFVGLSRKSSDIFNLKKPGAQLQSPYSGALFDVSLSAPHPATDLRTVDATQQLQIPSTSPFHGNDVSTNMIGSNPLPQKLRFFNGDINKQTIPIINQQLSDQRVKVVNVSMLFKDDTQEKDFESIVAAHPDITFVMAAGNSRDSNPQNLADGMANFTRKMGQTYPNMIVVAATDEVKKSSLAYYSNAGTPFTSIAARGFGAASDFFGFTLAEKQGTPIASPFVWDAINKSLLQAPDLQPVQIRKLVEISGTGPYRIEVAGRSNDGTVTNGGILQKNWMLSAAAIIGKIKTVENMNQFDAALRSTGLGKMSASQRDQLKTIVRATLEAKINAAPNITSPPNNASSTETSGGTTPLNMARKLTAQENKPGQTGKTISNTSSTANFLTMQGSFSREQLAQLITRVDNKARAHGRGGSLPTRSVLESKISNNLQDDLFSVQDSTTGQLVAAAAVGSDVIRNQRGQLFDGVKVDYLSDGSDPQAIQKLTLAAYHYAQTHGTPLIIYPASETLSSKVYAPKLHNLIDSGSLPNAELLREKTRDGETFFVIKQLLPTHHTIAAGKTPKSMTDIQAETKADGLTPSQRTARAGVPSSLSPEQVKANDAISNSMSMKKNKGDLPPQTKFSENRSWSAVSTPEMNALVKRFPGLSNVLKAAVAKVSQGAWRTQSTVRIEDTTLRFDKTRQATTYADISFLDAGNQSAALKVNVHNRATGDKETFVMKVQDLPKMWGDFKANPAAVPYVDSVKAIRLLESDPQVSKFMKEHKIEFNKNWFALQKNSDTGTQAKGWNEGVQVTIFQDKDRMAGSVKSSYPYMTDTESDDADRSTGQTQDATINEFIGMANNVLSRSFKIRIDDVGKNNIFIKSDGGYVIIDPFMKSLD
jgi:hypothetical protein